MNAPAIGLIELSSIATGMLTLDAMVKQSPVAILRAHAVSPGKYLILVGGEVAEVDEAMQAGLERAEPFLIDRLFLPYAHECLLPLLKGKLSHDPLDAMAIVETLTVASCLLAVDAAAKAAPVRPMEMHLANQLGGKGYFTFTGDQADVEAALEAAVTAAGQHGFSSAIIPLPHPDIHPHVS
jgi:microcompartment protein CcmL/EutN